MRIRLFWLFVLPTLAFAERCNAATIKFDDLTDGILVYLDGTLITGDQGRISNFKIVGELVTFDLALITPATVPETAYTDLLNRTTGDDPQDTVSDRFIFASKGGIAHITFGSDSDIAGLPPGLPAIPIGATDATTIPAQDLPPNPYYENGAYQQVFTIFQEGPPIIEEDTFFARSDAPEPSTFVVWSLMAGIFAIGGLYTRVKESTPKGE
jgi:hypothetical protein